MFLVSSLKIVRCPNDMKAAKVTSLLIPLKISRVWKGLGFSGKERKENDCQTQLVVQSA